MNEFSLSLVNLVTEPGYDHHLSCPLTGIQDCRIKTDGSKNALLQCEKSRQEYHFFIKTSDEKKCKIVPFGEEDYFFFFAAGFFVAAAFFAGFLAAAFFAAAIRDPPPTGKGYIFSQSVN